MNQDMMLTIIVPCCNEQGTLLAFYQKISEVLGPLSLDYELLLIDDGSTDQTLSIMRETAEADPCVQYLSFSRNFGKEAAMYAGFSHAKGDYVAVMDADLQDPPDLLPQMLSILEEGEYDSVATRRVSRKGEPKIRSFFARRFYGLINRMSDVQFVDGARDFRLMKREMAEAIVAMGEYNRFSKGIYGWIGFKTYWLEYENVRRMAGESKWSFWKLFRYAAGGIVDFSQIPLSIVSGLGMAMTGCSFLALLLIIIRRLAFGDDVAGWASLVCIVIFIGGMELFALGIIGQYLAKTYLETKKRPHYIIAQSSREDVKRVG